MVHPENDRSRVGVVEKDCNPIDRLLIRVEGNRIEVSGVDMLDGTPLLDIKPYVPACDAPGPVRIGWLEDRAGQVASVRDDGRFAE